MQTAVDYYIGISVTLVAALMFAVTNVVYKRLDKDISVIEILVTRLWVSIPIALIFYLPSFLTDGLTTGVGSMIVLFVSMFLGTIIGDGFYFSSQSKIGVSRAYPIASAYPLLVYFLTALFLEEPVILSRFAGAVIIVVGVGLIARERVDDPDEKETIDTDTKLIGGLFALCTLCFWALHDVFLQVGLVDVNPFEANFLRIVLGSLVILPVLPYSKKKSEGFPDRRMLGLLFLIGIIGFGIPLTLITYSVSLVGATVMSIIISASPLFGTPISALYLDERLTRGIVLGTILVFFGVVLVIVAI